jgi:Trypsin
MTGGSLLSHHYLLHLISNEMVANSLPCCNIPRVRSFLKSLLGLAFLTIFLPISAQANFGGSTDLGDQRVLALLTSNGLIDGVRGFSPLCSGSMIAPQIVVAAAHCLRNPDHTYTSEIYSPTNIYVSKPGANLDIQNPEDPIKVLRVILTSGYTNSFHPEAGNIITQKDDIAFYFLASPLVEKYSIPIATPEDVAQIKSRRLMITHIGYGLHGVNEHDGIPRIVQLQAYSQGSSRYGNNPARDDYTIASQETGDKALCPGDSGSPWYATVNGVEKLTAVTVSASGCNAESDQKGGTMGTLIWPYVDLMNRQWPQFQLDLPELLKQEASSTIDLSLPYIEREGGCDAFVKAWLQIQSSDGSWSDFKEAQGWKTIPSCPGSNPYHPWVRALVPNGVMVRWKIVAPNGSWTFLTDPYLYAAPNPPDPAATPSPTLMNNAVGSFAASPSPTPIVSPLHPVKDRTITCRKGKTVKIVSGKLPKCPNGYILKP